MTRSHVRRSIAGALLITFAASACGGFKPTQTRTTRSFEPVGPVRYVADIEVTQLVTDMLGFQLAIRRAPRCEQLSSVTEHVWQRQYSHRQRRWAKRGPGWGSAMMGVAVPWGAYEIASDDTSVPLVATLATAAFTGFLWMVLSKPLQHGARRTVEFDRSRPDQVVEVSCPARDWEEIGLQRATLLAPWGTRYQVDVWPGTDPSAALAHGDQEALRRGETFLRFYTNGVKTGARDLNRPFTDHGRLAGTSLVLEIGEQRIPVELDARMARFVVEKTGFRFEIPADWGSPRDVTTRAPDRAAPAITGTPDQRACMQGDAKACTRAAESHGIELQTSGAGAEYAKKGCEGGEGASCYLVGVSLSERDDARLPARWFEKACDLGHARGCYEMGLFYAKSLTLWTAQGPQEERPADPARAQSYFDKACSLGHRDACERRGAGAPARTPSQQSAPNQELD